MIERQIDEIMNKVFLPLLRERTGVVNVQTPEGVRFDDFWPPMFRRHGRLLEMGAVLAGDQLVQWPRHKWLQILSKKMRRTWAHRFWDARLLTHAQRFSIERDAGDDLDLCNALDRLANPASAGVGDYWLVQIMAAFATHRRVIVTLKGMDGQHILGLNRLVGRRLRPEELLVNLVDGGWPRDINGEIGHDLFWRGVRPDNPGVPVTTIRLSFPGNT